MLTNISTLFFNEKSHVYIIIIDVTHLAFNFFHTIMGSVTFKDFTFLEYSTH